MSKAKKPAAVVDTEDVEALKGLADLVAESVEEGCRADLESFEVYAQKMRSHLHSDPQAFRAHFLKGYQVLLEELRKKSIS